MSEQPPTSDPYAPPPPPGYAPYGYPPYPRSRGTNGLAVASMVVGILWIYWIGSIVALVLGYIARRQIRQSGEGGDGMAVAGIVLGWVGIGTLILFLVFVVGFSTSGPHVVVTHT
jgi:hypothetical protein